MTSFAQWLRNADEDGKREASAYRHHFPVEQDYWLYDEEADEIGDEKYHEVVCGCEPDWAFEFMSEGHNPGDPPAEHPLEDEDEEVEDD